MSPLLTVVFLAIMLLVFAQFGKRIAARLSLVWWLVLAFIVIMSIDPELFRPVANLLGVQVISNFFLAAMIIFLFIQTIEHNIGSTRASRAIRRLVSMSAARAFVPRHTPPPSAGDAPTALLVMPCLDESASLPQVLPRLDEIAAANPAILPCIVDDGSRDATPAILAERMPDAFTSHDVNIGVSGALLTGFVIMQRLGLDYVVQCDADGQHPVELVPAMVREARQSGADLLIGSRFAATPLTRDGGAHHNARSTTPMRRLGLWSISQVLRLFDRRTRIADPTSGFRVYSRHAVNTLLKNMPDDYPEPESIAILMVQGLSIRECQVPMQARTGGRSSIRGLRPMLYMVKVMSALLGLRIRTLFGPHA